MQLWFPFRTNVSPRYEERRAGSKRDGTENDCESVADCVCNHFLPNAGYHHSCVWWTVRWNFVSRRLGENTLIPGVSVLKEGV